MIYIFRFKLLTEGNNIIECKGKIFGLKINIKGGKNRIKINGKVALNKKTTISIVGNDNIIVFDEGSSVSEGCRIRIEGNNNKLVIGERTSLVNVFFSMGDNNTDIEIGKDCLFSADVAFRNWDNHSIVMADMPDKRICKGKSIFVEDHVWIGNGVTVLKGVRIGHDSIIGTMSVVPADVPSNSVAVGNPARVVKNGVSWNVKWLESCV